MTESEQGIFNAILRANVDFTTDPWPSISPAAKDLVRKMLNSDPKQRLTAKQVLCKCDYIWRVLAFCRVHMFETHISYMSFLSKVNRLFSSSVDQGGWRST